MPTGVPDLPNPNERMAAANPLPATTKYTKLVQPEHYYDGTRMHVHFDPTPNAARTFLWVSAHADGRGAVNLAPNGLKPGQLVNGLRPEIKLHYWLTYTDDKGSASKPSPRHEEITIDNFKEK